MAEGKYYDDSGDFDRERDFEEVEDYDSDAKYRSEDNDYAAQNRSTRVNGKTVEDNLNSAGFGKFGQKENKDTGQKSWGLLKKGENDASQKNKSFLQKGEKDASQKPNSGGRGGDNKASLGEKENNVESDNNEKNDDDSAQSKFNNAVKGAKELKSGNILKARKSLKKAGPFFAILAIVLGFSGASFFGQAAMPFSLMSQINESFDSIKVSQGMRSKNFLRWQTAKESKKVKDCIKAHYFKADEFKVTKRQRNKLAKSGITFEDDPGGFTVMKHTGSDGSVKTIVADPDLATNGKVYFADAFENDIEFRNSYSEGSRTWRGSVSAWFDKGINIILNKLGIRRGIWDDFESGKKGDESLDEFRNRVSDAADSDSAKSRAGSTELEEKTVVDENGDPKIDRETGEEITETVAKRGASEESVLSRSDAKTDNKGRVTNTDGVKAKLKGVANKIGGIKNIINATVAVYCGVQDFVSAVHGIVAAYQTMQIIKTASAIFEGIQKGQIADSESAPVNEIATSLTQPTDNTYQEVKNVTNIKEISEDEYDSDAVYGDAVVRKRSAMEAKGITALYSGSAVDMNDPSVKSFNINNVTKNMTGVIASIVNHVDITAAGFRKCANARMAAAAASMVVDAVVFGLDFFTGGGASYIKALIDTAVKTGFQALKSLAISIAISFVTPFVAKILTRQIATTVMGEDLGNALVSGGNLLHGQNHRSQGGAVADKKSLIAYLQAKDVIIAEEARYERESLSPFDITSKYTFLGSLANKFVPLASSMTSVSSAISSAGGVVSNAFNALMPKSSAVSAAIEAQAAEENTEKYCPDLADIGAVGDGFCNPYIITDVSTMGTEPATVVDSISDSDLGTDGAGNPVIKEDSKLAKYIIYCGQRSSPFGSIDQNIAGDVDKASEVGGKVGNAIIQNIPIVGDAFDIASSKQKMNNIGWITGASCVVNNNIGKDDYVDWKEGKKYQRFIEDQRLAEAEGIIQESAVSKFIASYYEKNPIDTSFEGMLARYSGQAKEIVEATIALFELSEWVADYDPSELLPYYDASQKIRAEDNNIQIEQSGFIAYMEAVVPKRDNRSNRFEYYYSA